MVKMRSIEEQVEDIAKRELLGHKIKYFGKTESINSEIDDALKKAPSKSGGAGSNFPDIKLLIKTKSNRIIPVMIEAKGDRASLEKATAAVDMFGFVQYRSYPYKMVTHARVFSLSPKIQFDKKIGLYIVSCMQYFRQKFSYSNMASWKKIADITISLPIIADGEIDCSFMESFISAQQKLVIKDVICWKDKVIQETKHLVGP